MTNIPELNNVTRGAQINVSSEAPSAGPAELAVHEFRAIQLGGQEERAVTDDDFDITRFSKDTIIQGGTQRYTSWTRVPTKKLEAYDIEGAELNPNDKTYVLLRVFRDPNNQDHLDNGKLQLKMNLETSKEAFQFLKKKAAPQKISHTHQSDPHSGTYHWGGTYTTKNITDATGEVIGARIILPNGIKDILYQYNNPERIIDAFLKLRNCTSQKTFSDIKTFLMQASAPSSLKEVYIVHGDVKKQLAHVEDESKNQNTRTVVINASQINWQEQLSPDHDIKTNISGVYDDPTFGPGIVTTQDGGPEMLAHALYKSNKDQFPGAFHEFFSKFTKDQGWNNTKLKAQGGYYSSNLDETQWQTLVTAFQKSDTKTETFCWKKENGTVVYQTGGINSNNGSNKQYAKLHQNKGPSEELEFSILYTQMRSVLLQETGSDKEGKVDIHTTRLGEGVFSNTPGVALLALRAAILSLPDAQQKKIASVSIGTYGDNEPQEVSESLKNFKKPLVIKLNNQAAHPIERSARAASGGFVSQLRVATHSARDEGNNQEAHPIERSTPIERSIRAARGGFVGQVRHDIDSARDEIGGRAVIGAEHLSLGERATVEAFEKILSLLPNGQYPFYVHPPRFVDAPDIKWTIKKEGETITIYVGDNTDPQMRYPNSKGNFDLMMTYFLRPNNGMTRCPDILGNPGIETAIKNYWREMGSEEIGGGWGYTYAAEREIRRVSNDDIYRHSVRGWHSDHGVPIDISIAAPETTTSFTPKIPSNYWKLASILDSKQKKDNSLGELSNLVSPIDLASITSCPVKVKVVGQEKYVWMDYSVVEAKHRRAPFTGESLDLNHIQNITEDEITALINKHKEAEADFSQTDTSLTAVFSAMTDIDKNSLPEKLRKFPLTAGKYNNNHQVRIYKPDTLENDVWESIGNQLYVERKGGNSDDKNYVFFSQDISQTLMSHRTYQDKKEMQVQTGIGRHGSFWANWQKGSIIYEISKNDITGEIRFYKKEEGKPWESCFPSPTGPSFLPDGDLTRNRSVSRFATLSK